MTTTTRMADRYNCDLCKSYNQAPMLKQEVWKRVAPLTTILCLECTEKRLGRELMVDDMIECPMNHTAIVMTRRAEKQNVKLIEVLLQNTNYELSVEVS